MLGDVSIVQSMESPLGSSIVRLNEDVSMETSFAPLLIDKPEKRAHPVQ